MNQLSAISFLKAIGDHENLAIINCVIDRAKTKHQICKQTKIKQTTLYRKTKILIEQGILVPKGFVIMNEYPITKYRSCFKKLRINIDGKETSMELDNFA